MDDDIRIESTAPDPQFAQTILEFLQPFVDRRLILPRTLDEITGLMRNGFWARRGDRIVGFVALEVYSRKLGEIQCLAVADDCQRRGIGRELVRRCVQRARELGVHELMAISASEAMFRACGFDYSLPDQKRALFIQPLELQGPGTTADRGDELQE